jgi:hypothetical protein
MLPVFSLTHYVIWTRRKGKRELAKRLVDRKSITGTSRSEQVVNVFVRWAENPRDRVAGFRVLKLLPGIGPTTAAKVQDQVEEQPGTADVLLSIEVPKAAAEDWPGFAKVVGRIMSAAQIIVRFAMIFALSLCPLTHPSSRRPFSNAATRDCASGSLATRPISTPIRRIRSICCARAANGHAAAPWSSVMNSRRL